MGLYKKLKVSTKKAAKRYIADKKDSAKFRRKVAIESREIRREAYLKESKIQARIKGKQLASMKSKSGSIGERIRTGTTKAIRKQAKKPVSFNVKDLL